MPEVRAILLAFGLMTRLPVDLPAVEPSELARATRYYPLPGAVLAILLLGGVLVGTTAAGRPFGIVLGMGLVFIGNGGLHLDGLLDCLDGWFCMGDKEKRLQAMKDPRAGALGAIGIGHFLLLKAALFWACMERGMLVEAVWAALVLARMPLAFELGFLPQATPGRGLAAYIRPGWLDGLVALLLTSGLLAPILLVAPERWLPLTVGAGLGLAITLLWHIAWQQRIQGINGDVLGAAIELREAALLAGFAIYLPG